jgi:hypothetical protein
LVLPYKMPVLGSKRNCAVASVLNAMVPM